MVDEPRRRGRPRKALQGAIVGAAGPELARVPGMGGSLTGDGLPEEVDAMDLAKRLGLNPHAADAHTGTAVAEIFTDVYEDGTVMVARLRRETSKMEPFLLAKGGYSELVGPELDGKRLAAFRRRAEKWA